MGSSIYKLNTKSIARLAAVQTWYSYQTCKDTNTIESSLSQIIEYYKDQSNIYEDYDLKELGFNKDELSIKPSYSFLEKLVQSTNNNLSEIDKIISANLKNNWLIERLPTLTLALLRVAICELMILKDTSHKVIINEYTNIASDLLDDTDVGFVNSLLDTLIKKDM